MLRSCKEKLDVDHYILRLKGEVSCEFDVISEPPKCLFVN